MGLSLVGANPSLGRQRLGRAALVVGALALLLSVAFPYWRMRVAAPQYPKGLSLVIYLNRLEGDVREIDGLNHYIGMRPLAHGAKTERRIAIPGLIVAVLGLLLATATPRRWAILFALPALLVPPLFAGDLYGWMRDYGLHLDPKAPLNHSIKPFVPPLLGPGTIAQFHTAAGFAGGFNLTLVAAALALVGIWLRFRRKRAAPSTAAAVALVAAVTLLGGAAVEARTVVVEPSARPAALQEVVAQAADGDTLVVRGGVHRGPLVIAKPLALVGEGTPVIDGGGTGTVVRLEAPGITLRGFTIRASGDLLAQGDAGVLVNGADARIEGNRFEDVLFGVSFHRAPRGQVRGNTIGGKALPVPRRGDAIRLWESDDAVIEDNAVSEVRDVVLWFSQHVAVRRNAVRRGRYGLHVMYCNDSIVEGNRLDDNSVGVYLMYSTRLHLRGNHLIHNRGPSGYGLGLKDMEDVVIEGNVLADNRVGIFLEHANGMFRGNLIGENDIGIRFLPSALHNVFTANSFVENGEQVVVDGAGSATVGNRWNGNYWSDYRGYDANGDGIGEIPYHAVELFEGLADRYPALRLYRDSPAARTIEFAAQLFPIFAPRPTLADESPRLAPIPPSPQHAPRGPRP